MLECPWCNREIEIKNGRCPECHRKLYEVSEEDFETVRHEDDDDSMNFVTYNDDSLNDLSVEQMIENRFKCSKCGETECKVQEVAMTGAGLSKLLDIQHRHYLFVSCTTCGSVEVYDPDILHGMKAGRAGTIMDILFGGG
ncbi:zinc ribbon domain-containing protein [Fontibacillus sp. BL9]|uniref:zinc ribbon domain-containing protein n=1 Tax=Fontibacillus sp. BL9 TaxID=3389971 RepID=UPI00397E835A